LHAWVQSQDGFTASNPTLLTAGQIHRIVKWLQSAKVVTMQQRPCGADPLPLDAAVYLDIRGPGIVVISSMLSCRTSPSTANGTTYAYTMSSTHVAIGGPALVLGYLLSPPLATFLRQAPQEASPR
jgi:hypothetical protein